MIREHDRIILNEDMPESNLRAGDVGVVVMIHGNHEGYEVEFFTLAGETLDVLTLDAAQIRTISEHEVLHARSLHAL